MPALPSFPRIKDFAAKFGHPRAYVGTCEFLETSNNYVSCIGYSASKQTRKRLDAPAVDTQQEMANAGSMSAIIGLLKDGHAGNRKYALWSLSLAIDESNQKTLLATMGNLTGIAYVEFPSRGQ